MISARSSGVKVPVVKNTTIGRDCEICARRTRGPIPARTVIDQSNDRRFARAWVGRCRIASRRTRASVLISVNSRAGLYLISSASVQWEIGRFRRYLAVGACSRNYRFPRLEPTFGCCCRCLPVMPHNGPMPMCHKSAEWDGLRTFRTVDAPSLAIVSEIPPPHGGFVGPSAFIK